MARRGEYRLYSGEPPFVPTAWKEGGIIDAVGERCRPSDWVRGLSCRCWGPAPGAPNPVEGTLPLRTIARAGSADGTPAPDNLPDDGSGYRLAVAPHCVGMLGLEARHQGGGRCGDPRGHK